MAQFKELKTTITLYGKIDKSLDKALKAANSKSAKSANKIGKFFKTAMKTATVAVAAGAAALTVAVAGFGIEAVKSAETYQAQMQNVATLLDGTAEQVKARTAELSADVLKISNATGISTENLTSGLYDVVSAIGDTEDSIKILEISAKAAAAGQAETSEAISLLTAVTKGYGDTSADAFNKASDLAFQTVKLGQTTFPELAASIGKVTPLAAALGIEQEELFGVFATLTGVTGTAAEVSTQYKAVLSGLMSPSKDMQDALKKMGYSTATAALEAEGFQGVLNALMGTVDGDTQKMAKLFSSVEAQTAILALCGAQADNLTTKTEAMRNATGATEAAFATQTDSLAYVLQKLHTLWDNLKTTVGMALLPIIQKIAEDLFPTIEEAVGQLGPKLSEGYTALAPILTALSEIVKKYIPVIVQKISEIVPLIAPIVTTILTEGIPALEAMASTIINNLQPGFEAMAPFAEILAAGLLEFGKTAAKYLPVIIDFLTFLVGNLLVGLADMLEWLGKTKAFEILQNYVVYFMNNLKLLGSFVSSLFLGEWDGAWQAVCDSVSVWQEFMTSSFGFVIDNVMAQINDFGNIIVGIFGWFGEQAKAQWNEFLTIFSNYGPFENIMIIVDTVKTNFAQFIDFINNVFAGNWSAAWTNVVNIFSNTFNGIKSVASNVINRCISVINGMIRGVNKVGSYIKIGPIPEIPLVAFARGGTVTSPTLALIGEAGDAETVVPHNNKPRSRALLQEAAQGVYGKSSGSKTTRSFTYAPVIYANDKTGVKEVLQDDFERFKAFMQKMKDEDDREVFV